MPKRKLNNFPPGRAYLLFALGVLFFSVVFWSVLGAKIQSNNPNQIVNSLLFANRSTFEHALIPIQQTFLIKWPLYYLIHLFGTTNLSLVIFTVVIDLLTVGLFVLILSRIEKRSSYLATICLAVASCLLLVPSLASAGTLQPVNIAMLAARNIEYIIFIYGLILLIKSPKLKSRQFWYAIALMLVVIASDKFLFVSSIIGAGLALIYYGLIDKIVTDNIVTKWLSITIGGLIGSAGLLWLISASTITKFTSVVIGNYQLSTNIHTIFRGTFYALTALLTNFGANPAAMTTAIHQVPRAFISNLFGFGVVGYSVNLVILVLGFFLVFKITRHSLTPKNTGKKIFGNHYNKTAAILCWTSLASVIVFIFTKHNYSVDANYLTIVFFAVFMSIAVYSKSRKVPERVLFILGFILFLGTVSGVYPAWNNYRSNQVALNPTSQANDNIVDALAQHPVNVLVGNYTQVIPIKQQFEKQKTIMPLSDCTTPTETLSSVSWHPKLQNTSFAYILNLDPVNNEVQACTLAQIKDFYGSPNTSILISGSISSPKVLLLFYDRGLNKKNPSRKANIIPVVTTAPIPFTDLPAVSCSVPTLMTIVAHQDDDLLFMNPDLSKKVKAGDCVRAIYLTAGDDGKSSYYWLGRQIGSEAAYSAMLGVSKVWLERNIQLAINEYIVIASPEGNPNISLVFFHLPDGNLNGQGFMNNNLESLAGLYSGRNLTIQSVDRQSVYSSSGLVNAIVSLMHYYQPSEIWTQSSFFTSGDHSDHITTGKFVTRAYNSYELQQYQGLVTIPISYFVGYPIRSMLENVTDQDLALKAQIFSTYAKQDSNICNQKGCYDIGSYSGYFPREYTEPY